MFRTVIIVSLASAALSGCAQDTRDVAAEDRHAQVDIPPSTQLNELTAEQRVELCEVGKRTFPAGFECQVESAAQESSPAACEHAQAACLEEKRSALEEDCARVAAEPIECDAAVELLVACLDEQIIAIPEAFGALTCEDAEHLHFGDVVDATLSLRRLTPSCQRLTSRCPSMADRDDDR